jgi:hypothetical protein
VAESPKVKRRAKGARPYFFDDPSVDKVLAIVMALAGEVSVLRDRLDTVVRLVERKGVLSADDLETFLPDAPLRAERDAWRDEFLNRILRIVRVELEDVESENTPEAYRQAISEVAE